MVSLQLSTQYSILSIVNLYGSQIYPNLFIAQINKIISLSRGSVSQQNKPKHCAKTKSKYSLPIIPKPVFPGSLSS